MKNSSRYGHSSLIKPPGLALPTRSGSSSFSPFIALSDLLPATKPQSAGLFFRGSTSERRSTTNGRVPGLSSWSHGAKARLRPAFGRCSATLTARPWKAIFIYGQSINIIASILTRWTASAPALCFFSIPIFSRRTPKLEPRCGGSISGPFLLAAGSLTATPVCKCWPYWSRICPAAIRHSPRAPWTRRRGSRRTSS